MNSKRKELYEIIKKNNWQKEIIAMFGKNMTQVSNENLSMFITDKDITEQANEKQEKRKEKEKEKTYEVKDVKCRKAIINLLSCLEALNYLTSTEVENVLKELK